MPRCSDNVAALVAALARAQTELVNPEKTLQATLPAERGRGDRTFRYASLAVGLDIVRKTLGRHEIATLQSTAIDQNSGTIRLTTTLAHASGEWVASDWPVCTLADLSAPQRMGAALSYARRYGLFTLVGIAGDDDLDARDLAISPADSAQPSIALAGPVSTVSQSAKRNGSGPTVNPVLILGVEQSAATRDHLMTELAALEGFDNVAQWAKRIISIKNTMRPEDARGLEAALGAKLQQFECYFDDDVEAAAAAPPSERGIAAGAVAAAATVSRPQKDTKGEWLATTDRSTLQVGHSPRRRNKAHLKFVAAQPCLLCSRQPSDAHHLRFAQVRAIGCKVSDEYTVPLCRTHHRQLHRGGNEVEWWKAMGAQIDPLVVARSLWEQSHRK